MKPKSELAWKLADYQQAEMLPPERLASNPQACEGELMTAREVNEHISDCIGTLLVMLDSGSTRFSQVREGFVADLDFLLQLGKITPDEYNEIVSSEEMTQT